MLISEIENLFKEVFNEEKGLVKSVTTVFENPEEDGYLKLVISIHNLTVEDSIIIHTKFIFKTDKDKINIKGNSFNYLYDINCIYHQKNFTDILDLKKTLIKIIDSNKFGDDIQKLSEFIDRPATFINSYFSNNNITKYSVSTVKYDPKFNIKPCNETTFDFEINVGDFIITVTLIKTDSNRKGKEASYKFTFKLLDHMEESKVDEITNLHAIIGGKIIEMLDKFVK